MVALEEPEKKDSDEEEESQSQKRPLVFGDSSDEEQQPSKRQKLSESENSDDDIPLSAVSSKQSGLWHFGFIQYKQFRKCWKLYNIMF